MTDAWVGPVAGWLGDRSPFADLLGASCAESVAGAAALIVEAVNGGGKVLVAGNGGSAAEAQHLASELVGRFVGDRPGLPAVALTCDTSALTAIGNDYGFERVFSRQVEALGRPGDVLVAFSTSATSPNVVRAAEAAKAAGMRTIAVIGRRPGLLTALADVTIACPGPDTAGIQEHHLAVVHALCRVVDGELFGHEGPPRWRPGSCTLDALVALREQWRAAGLTVVTTNGCFDVLHVGHLQLLERAAALGDVVVVAVNTDDSVHRLKGEGRPVVELADRMALLAALRPVWAVVAFEEDTPVAVLDALAPDVHCKGADYVDAARLPEYQTVVGHGGRVELIDLVDGRSTTSIAERLRGPS
jgi:phosphoheptose isomerase